MKPVIIDIIPQKGSTDVALNSPIIITLADPIVVPTSNNFLVFNITKNTAVNFTIMYEANSETITLIPEDSIVEGKFYQQLNEYRVEIKNLRDFTNSDLMYNSYVTEFSTKAEELIIQDSNAYVLSTFPSLEKDYITPSVIKVKISEDIVDLELTAWISSDADINNLDIYPYTHQDCVVDITNNIVSITPVVALLDNLFYTVGIDGLTNEVTVFQFHSKLSPYYISSSGVYSSNLSLVNNITKENENLLKQTIYENSVLAETIADEAGNLSAIQTTPTPVYVANYVIYKTRYDIIMDKYLEISANPTSEQLNDFTIEYGQNLGKLMEIAAQLKIEYEKYERQIKGLTGGNLAGGVFIKGSNSDTLEEFTSRGFKDYSAGTKSW